MQHTDMRRSGQVLIEVIIAALVIILVSLAITELVDTSLKGTSASMSGTAAAFLSGETIDAMRAVARADWHSISILATSSANLYHPAISGNAWTVVAGSETTTLNSITYTRSFYLTDVYRSTSTGDIVSSGGYYDPSTIKVNAAVNWSDRNGSAETFTQAGYLSRYFNQTYAQTDWSGGSAGESVTAAATTTFATSSNIDSTSTAGSIQLVPQ